MLNTWKSLIYVNNVVKPVLNEIPNLYSQQIRNHVILKRQFPPRLHKKNAKLVKFHRKDFIYDVVEHTEHRKREPVDIILTQVVEGFGEKGDKISVKPNKAYTQFLLPGLAVYASPENIKKHLIDNENKEKKFSSRTAPLAIKFLRRFLLPVRMSIENPWVIERWHIKANFKLAGVIVPDSAITLPEKEISGPNLDNEGKEFYVKVTINKQDDVFVRCRLLHDTFEITKQLPYVPDRWKIPGPAIFPEDQEFLDSLPRPKYEEDEKDKN